MRANLNFINNHYGVCSLKELEKNSEEIVQFIKDSHLSKLKIYEIYNHENIFLGFSGFYESQIEGDVFPNIFIYVDSKYQQHGIGDQILNLLVDFIFNTTKYDKILINSFNTNLTKLLQKYGFNKNNLKMELTRFTRKLYHLSKIIKEEAKSLHPQNSNLVNDLADRASRMWYSYFSRGICLSNGGVEKSFIEIKDSLENSHLETFNMYETESKYSLSQEQIKKFLVDEGAISITNNLESLSVSFSLGSHEGFIRTARCIYRKGFNEGIFFPSGGYGLLAVAIADLKPLSYQVNIIKVDKNKGEKILLDDLSQEIVKYPKNKTLFLDMKTTCGAVYTPTELKEIVSFCKTNKIFLIADAAHFNMEFSKKNSIPDIFKICQELDYNEFIVMYTGSKTYGLERARTGFILLSEKNSYLTLKRMNDDFLRVFGTISDLPLYIAYQLVNSSLTARQEFLTNTIKKHRINMNLMITYIEGINSLKIDTDLKKIITKEIPLIYQVGIKGMKIVYKPESGIQMKVDISDLKNKYFTNIRMFNAEIFSYALNKIADVVSLHSYQILDPEGYSMRLSFSIKEDVHQGMKAIHNFVNSLTDIPSLNPFFPDYQLAENLIFPEKRQSISVSNNHFSFLPYREHQNTAHAGHNERLIARL